MWKFKKEFVAHLEEVIERQTDTLTVGNATNLREYGLLCGRISQAKEILREFNELWEEFGNVDGDFDEDFTENRT